jgi:hypothetical protein
MVRVRRALIVLSVIWLVALFGFLGSIESSRGDFLFIFTLFGLIPVILINGIWWIIFER